MALLTFRTLKQTTILVHTDNTTVKAYVNKQGETRLLSLSKLATELWEMCLARGLQISRLNTFKASTTRRRTRHRGIFSRRMRPTTFQALQHTMGSHDVGRFADRVAHLLPRYVARHLDPGAIAMDTPTVESYPSVPTRTGDRDADGAILGIGSVVPPSPASAGSMSPHRVDVSLRRLSVNKSTLKMSVWQVSGTGLPGKDTRRRL